MKVKLQLFKQQILERFSRRITEERISFRRVTIEENISYDHLVQYLLTAIKQADNTLTNESYALMVQYMDDESDWIDICTANEWEEAKQVYKQYNAMSSSDSILKLKCVVKLDNKELVARGGTSCGRTHGTWENWHKRGTRFHRHHGHPERTPFGGFFSQLFLDKDENKKDKSQDSPPKKHNHCIFEKSMNQGKKLWNEKLRESENFLEEVVNIIQETCEQTKGPFENTLFDIFDAVFGEKTLNEKKANKEPSKTTTTTSNDSASMETDSATNVQNTEDDNRENEIKRNQLEQQREKAENTEDEASKGEIKEQVKEEEKETESKNIHHSSLSSSFVDLTEDAVEEENDAQEAINEVDEHDEDEDTHVVENTLEINEHQEATNDTPMEKKDTETNEPNVEQPFKEEMEALSAMGFSNTKLNMQLLSFYKGDMDTVLNTLLKL